MNITGHRIIQRLKELKAERSMLNDRYPGTLFQFPSDLEQEDALMPEAIIGKLVLIEGKIAWLQHAQARYGQKVEVIFEGHNCTLALAVKLLGGMDRAEKLWRQAAKVSDGERGKRRTLFSDYDRKKSDPDEERLVRVVSLESAMKQAQAMSRRCSAMRGAIAVANSRETTCAEIGLDPELLE